MKSAPAAGGEGALGPRGQLALEAAASGLYVFPLYPGTKNMPAVPDWENEATRDPEKITQWWAQRPYNLAIATGPSRLVVVDLDPLKSGAPALDEPYEKCKHGLQVFQQMAAAAGEKFPLDTYRVQSPSNGVHLYFRAPDDVELRNSQRRLAPLLDVRAGGGYIVLRPPGAGTGSTGRRTAGRSRRCRAGCLTPCAQRAPHRRRSRSRSRRRVLLSRVPPRRRAVVSGPTSSGSSRTSWRS